MNQELKQKLARQALFLPRRNGRTRFYCRVCNFFPVVIDQNCPNCDHKNHTVYPTR